MRPTTLVFVVLLAPMLLACSADVSAVQAACHEPGTVEYASTDGRVALCLPSGFIRRSSGTSWTRGVATDSAVTYVVVAALDSTERAKIEWPPRLLDAPTGALHERVCENVVVRNTQIDERPVQLWSGRCTAPGIDRMPTITAGWSLPNGDVGFLVAWGDLADVERAIATIRIR